MNTNHIPHVTRQQLIENVELRVSFWPNERGPGFASILKMGSQSWDVQVNVTAHEIRKLALMLVEHAESLEIAKASAIMEAV